MLGATPFSIYVTYPPAEIRYLIDDAGLEGGDRRAGATWRAMLEARRDLPGLEHVIVVDGDAPEGTISLADVEALEPRVRSRQVRGGDRARRPGHADLHLGHDRAAEGRSALAPQRHVGGPGGRGGHHARCRLAKVISWLPAAHIAERMAHHYIPVIYAGTITCCPNPREVLVVPAAGPADLVLRRPADLGEAEGRARDDAGGPARGAATPDPGGARGGDRARAAPAAGRARAGRARGEGRPGRRADVLQAARDARPRPGDRGQRRRRADAGRGARVLPRARDRAGGAVGHVRDVRVGHVQPAR